MDLLYYGAPLVALVGIIIYFFEVWWPNFRDGKKDVDLEEAKAVVSKDKEATKGTIDEINNASAALKQTIAIIEAEAAKDKAATENAIGKADKDAKSFLESEGFNVKEIFPE